MPMRDELVKSYRKQQDEPMRHFVAVAVASDWYRDNPRPPRRERR